MAKSRTADAEKRTLTLARAELDRLIQMFASLAEAHPGEFGQTFQLTWDRLREKAAAAGDTLDLEAVPERFRFLADVAGKFCSDFPTRWNGADSVLYSRLMAAGVQIPRQLPDEVRELREARERLEAELAADPDCLDRLPREPEPTVEKTPLRTLF